MNALLGLAIGSKLVMVKGEALMNNITTTNATDLINKTEAFNSTTSTTFNGTSAVDAAVNATNVAYPAMFDNSTIDNTTTNTTMDLNMGRYGSTEAVATTNTTTELSADGMIHWSGLVLTGNDTTNTTTNSMLSWSNITDLIADPLSNNAMNSESLNSTNAHVVDYNAMCEAINVLPDNEGDDAEEEGGEDIDGEENPTYASNSTTSSNSFFSFLTGNIYNTTNGTNNSSNSTASTNSTSTTHTSVPREMKDIIIESQFLLNSSTLPDSEFRNISTDSNYAEEDRSDLSGSDMNASANATYPNSFPAFNDLSFTNFMLDSGALQNRFNVTASGGINANTNSTSMFFPKFNSTDIFDVRSGFINSSVTSVHTDNSTTTRNSSYDAVHFGEFFFNGAPAPYDYVRKNATNTSDASSLEVVADDLSEDVEEDSWLREKLDGVYHVFNSYMPAENVNFPHASKMI